MTYPARDPTNQVCRDCCRIGVYCGEERKDNILHYCDRECVFSQSQIVCPYKYCKGSHEVKECTGVYHDDTCAQLTEENIDEELVTVETFSFLPFPKEIRMMIIKYLGCCHDDIYTSCMYKYPLLGLVIKNETKYYCSRVCYTNTESMIDVGNIDKLERLEKSRDLYINVEGHHIYKYVND